MQAEGERPEGHAAGRSWLLSPSLRDKLDRVTAILAGFERVLVAFSGGVDSTLLAALARDVLGRANVLAVTADSPSMAREDLADARQLAARLDLNHLVIETREVEDPAYRANTAARCYFCKHELFETLGALAKTRRIPIVLYGAIGDDRPSERPGQWAAGVFGVRAPLQEAGVEKWEVRALASARGLPNWDRPQDACLASRIPHGRAVTEGKLRQAEAAESVLRSWGFRQVRVRHGDTHARIEVGADEVARFRDPALRADVAARLGALGFETVGVNRSGYQAGGADQPVADELPLHPIIYGGNPGFLYGASPSQPITDYP